MRLIDADALIETLETYKFGAIQNEVERAYIKETVINFVKDAPTAYDTEAVVAKLKENGQKMAEAKTILPYGKGSPSCHRYYKAISVKKATDIVKRGGEE